MLDCWRPLLHTSARNQCHHMTMSHRQTEKLLKRKTSQTTLILVREKLIAMLVMWHTLCSHTTPATRQGATRPRPTPMQANVFPSHRMLLTQPMESKSQQLRMRTSLRLGMSLPRKAPVLQYLLALTLTRTRLQVSQMVLAASRRQGARKLKLGLGLGLSVLQPRRLRLSV